LTIPLAVIMTFTIFISGYYFLCKRSMSIVYPLASVLLLVIAGTITEISTRRTNELVIYNCPDRYAIGIRTGKLLNVYSDSIRPGIEVMRHSAMLRLDVRMNQTGREDNVYNAGGRKIMIGGSFNRGIIESTFPDVVVLTGDRPQIDKSLNGCTHPSELIFTSARSGYTNLPGEVYFNLIDSIHFVRESGAYISSLKKTNK
jgi:hypothetical protein